MIDEIVFDSFDYVDTVPTDSVYNERILGIIFDYNLAIVEPLVSSGFNSVD